MTRPAHYTRHCLCRECLSYRRQRWEYHKNLLCAAACALIAFFCFMLIISAFGGCLSANKAVEPTGPVGGDVSADTALVKTGDWAGLAVRFDRMEAMIERQETTLGLVNSKVQSGRDVNNPWPMTLIAGLMIIAPFLANALQETFKRLFPRTAQTEALASAIANKVRNGGH